MQVFFVLFGLLLLNGLSELAEEALEVGHVVHLLREVLLELKQLFSF